MFALLIAASLTAQAPAPAAKPDPAKAKELFNAGKKLYDQAKYGEAVVKFEEAYTARPHPVILFNIGKCYELIGETGKNELGKGLKAYREYLRATPDASDKQAVQDSIANLERKLKEKGLQQVVVFAEPANATVEIDGKALTGPSPMYAELKPGERKLVAKAEGFQTLERTFTMSAIRSQEVTVTLQAGTPGIPQSDAPKNDTVAANNNGTGSTVTPANNGTTGTTTGSSPAITKKPPPPAKKGRLFTWVAGGAAVVAGGVGAGLGVMAGGADSKLHDKSAAATRTRAEADQLVSTASSMSLGANVCYGVAGAAAVTAVILFFVEGS